MKANAVYHVTEHDDGRITHGVEHDNGGFVVSSQEVGVAVQNFLHFATLEDIATLHSHLLREYARRQLDPTFTYNSEKFVRETTAISKRGFNDGEAAASWIIDGNTNEPFMFLSRLLTGMEEGDPEIMDSLPMPRVSGEFADDPTWEQVCQDEIERYGDDGEPELFAVYNEAFHEGVECQLRKMYNDLSPGESKKV